MPAASAAAGGSAAAGPGCAVIKTNYEMTVYCPDSSPGTEYQVSALCPDGVRFSRWANQSYPGGVTMQCHGIRFRDINSR